MIIKDKLQKALGNIQSRYACATLNDECRSLQRDYAGIYKAIRHAQERLLHRQKFEKAWSSCRVRIEMLPLCDQWVIAADVLGLTHYLAGTKKQALEDARIASIRCRPYQPK